MNSTAIGQRVNGPHGTGTVTGNAQFEDASTVDYGNDDLGPVLELNANLTPVAPAPAEMFGTLTPDERRQLFLKLHDWAHEFYLVGHTLARTALAAGDYSGILWDHRVRYNDARDELAELAVLVGLAA